MSKSFIISFTFTESDQICAETYNISGTAMAYEMLVVFTRLTRLLLSAGRQTRNASGSTMYRYACSRENPNDSAASIVALGTDSMPERKISTLNAPAYIESPRIAQDTFDTMGTPAAFLRYAPTPK